MSSNGYGSGVTAKPRSQAELLLALSAITSSDTQFSAVVEQMEQLLVDAGVCTGLLVLDAQGGANFPIAGNGGPVPRLPSDAVLSRRVRAGARILRVLLVSKRENAGPLPRLADFVAEQVSALLIRDHLLGRRETLKSRIGLLEEELNEVKLLARAKGLLVGAGELSEYQSERWIRDKCRSTGASPSSVARQIIAALANRPGGAAATRRSA